MFNPLRMPKKKTHDKLLEFKTAPYVDPQLEADRQEALQNHPDQDPNYGIDLIRRSAR